ncbi:MAG: hypothetical protein M5U14_13900 [Acidimicrobiia bacterium]|nr:hypothetical protein [Acidimicrobiia bacterium]
MPEAPRGSEVRLRRFAATYPAVSVGVVPAGQTAVIAPRPDRSSLPWHVQVTAFGPVTLCAGS